MSIQQVCVVYVLRRGPKGSEVLLGRKLTGLGVGKVVAPGGKLEAGEDAADAARREVREEVGSAVEYADLREVALNRYRFPSRPTWDQDSHVFIARWTSGHIEASDELEPFWVAIEDVPLEEMWADARHWLPGVLRGERGGGAYTFGADLNTLV